jgi:hypothetical protein
MPAAKRPRNPDVAVERSDAPLGLYAALAGGLVVFLLISLLALRLIFPGSVSGPSDAPRSESAKPRLQVNPAGDLALHRAAEQKALTGYGWVDHQRGIVRIPIDRAMQDIASTGIKDWPESAK